MPSFTCVHQFGRFQMDVPSASRMVFKCCWIGPANEFSLNAALVEHSPGGETPLSLRFFNSANDKALGVCSAPVTGSSSALHSRRLEMVRGSIPRPGTGSRLVESQDSCRMTGKAEVEA
jgi:hypothetical protein